MTNKLKIAILIITIYSNSAVAQTADNDSVATHRRWTLSVNFGLATGGPAKRIEKLMVAGDFNENDASGSPGAIGHDHPYSLTGLDFQSGDHWIVGINYLFRPPFTVGIVASRTTVGTTWGHRTPLYLDIQYSVTTFAPILAIQVSDILRFGAGPALYYPGTKTTSYGAEDQGKISRKTGFLIDFNLTLPAKTNFFFELKIQYRKVGGVEIGPFKSESLFFSSILPPTVVNYNHWFIGLGFGLGT